MKILPKALMVAGLAVALAAIGQAQPPAARWAQACDAQRAVRAPSRPQAGDRQAPGCPQILRQADGGYSLQAQPTTVGSTAASAGKR